jgi:hypothetical protein
VILAVAFELVGNPPRIEIIPLEDYSPVALGILTDAMRLANRVVDRV